MSLKSKCLHILRCLGWWYCLPSAYATANIFADQRSKARPFFDLSVLQFVCMCGSIHLSVYLTKENTRLYRLSRHFESTYFGTKVGDLCDSTFLLPSRFKMTLVLWIFFAATVKRLNRLSLDLQSDAYVRVKNCISHCKMAAVFWAIFAVTIKRLDRFS